MSRLVEVKERDEVEEAKRNPVAHEVALKYKAAVAWCRVMSKATGKAWGYKLIPHDAIQTTGSFKGVISNAIKIE